MKKIFSLSKKILPAAVALAVALPAHSAILEEVVVTATKRASNIQDIPQSAEAFSGEALVDMAITDFADLSDSIPAFYVGDGIVSTSINMRGMGSGGDRSFEQSVGMFIDGIYMPRSRQYRSPFFDAERIEVLRGPQAVLFGLNSTAGAVNVISAKTRPGDPFFADITAAYETEFEGKDVTFVIGGAVTDKLGLRFAGKNYESDGYVKNTETGKDENGREAELYRLTAVYQATESLTISGKFEYSDYDMFGHSGEAFGGQLDAVGVENTLNWVRSADGEFIGALEPGWNVKPGLFQRNDNAAVEVDYEFASGDSLTATFGYSDMYFEYAADVDTINGGPFFWGANPNNLNLALFSPNVAGADSSIAPEEYTQKSVELKWTSAQSDTFDYVGGIYWQDGELFNNNQSNTNFGPLAGNIVRNRSITLDVDSTTWSAYFSGTWHATDNVNIIAGARYVEEDKVGRRENPVTRIYAQDGTLLVDSGPGFEPLKEDRRSTNFLPEFVVQVDVSDDVMAYGKIGTSAKAGGFAAASSIAPGTFEYDDETVTTYEIGLKSTWLDGAAELNATVFRSDFDDLQVNSFISVGASTLAAIRNAASSVNQGLELNGRWAVNDWLTLSGSVSFLDAYYESYDQATCAQDVNPDGGGICDFSDRDLPYAPDVSSSFTADVSTPISDNLNFIAQMTLNYNDDYFTSGTLDNPGIQESYTKVSARVGVEAADGKWSLSLIGKNLTDEEILDVTQPLFGYYLGYLSQPATYTIQAAYHFGK